MQSRSVQTPGPRIEGARKLRVLVVDDYPETAEVISVLIEMLGHECRTAGTGRHALAEVLAFDPQVVVLDLGLPDMSGFDVARSLRDQPRGAERCIIALTGWATDADRRAAREAGCDEFLVKPATELKLRSALRAFAT